MTQDEAPLHWTAEWIALGFENMTAIGVIGVAVLACLYALRSLKYNRPVLRRERWWKRFLRRWRR